MQCTVNITSTVLKFNMAQDHNIHVILPNLVSKGLFQDNIPAIDIFDLDYFENRIKDLKTAFNEDFITHTLALKANPIKGIGESFENFVRKRALVKYQSQSTVIEMIPCFTILKKSNF